MEFATGLPMAPSNPAARKFPIRPEKIWPTGMLSPTL